MITAAQLGTASPDMQDILMMLMCYPVSTHFIYCSTYFCSKLCSVYSVVRWMMEEILFNSWLGQVIFPFSKASRSATGSTWFSFPWAGVTGVWSLPLNSISLSRLGIGGCMPSIPQMLSWHAEGTGLDFSTICHLWNFLHIMTLSWGFLYIFMCKLSALL